MACIKFMVSLLAASQILMSPVLSYAAERQVPNRPLIEHSFETGSGLPVKYFISTGKPNAPLIVFIQGSGCKPVMNGKNTEGGSTVYGFFPAAYKPGFNAMVIDKPFTADKDTGTGGVSEFCSKDFNNTFSFDNWFEVVDAAFTHAINNSDVSKKDVLVLGVSEGAVVASALASKHDTIRDLALIGASGDNQLFDFISLAHTNGRQNSIQEIANKAKEILEDPNNSEKFAWGHTYKRWSSFFKVSPSNLLKDTSKRIYLVSGTEDRSVPIQSTELLYSRLVLQGSDVRFRRVEGAGHNLLKNGDSWEKLEAEYKLITDWYLGFDGTP